ncbi:MAG: hypothetical protein HPY90_07765 [Syntrophothermus sp.]|uniref:PfkB family carbohydrate kinase n=1 Tax=Syntrophothermus sp. TaxID=2736299 RepID=UPI00257A0DA1|nr:PfkB family carbohydrate kinase [Syntrophothermus sp.]NSW83157.1 hypothetical protein [Syntrophothermus sp.]
MITPRWDVLGCGIVAVDDLLYVDQYPLADSKTPVLDIVREGGGLTGTALVAAARFGTKAAYGGILGYDELSNFTLEAFRREGVDVSAVVRRAGASTYHSIIIIDQATKTRTIFYTAKGVVARSPEEMSIELIGNCRVLLVDMLGLDGTIRAVQIAHSLGIPVVADIESADEPRSMELIEQVDHLIIPRHLAAQLSGSDDPEYMVKWLAKTRRACTAVTCGDQGTWYTLADGVVRHQPAFKIVPVDTNGCGDVFHGVYAACLAQDNIPLEQAILMVTAAAAIKATRPGGRSGIPDRRAVEQFLKERHDNEL